MKIRYGVAVGVLILAALFFILCPFVGTTYCRLDEFREAVSVVALLLDMEVQEERGGAFVQMRQLPPRLRLHQAFRYGLDGYPSVSSGQKVPYKVSSRIGDEETTAFCTAYVFDETVFAFSVNSEKQEFVDAITTLFRNWVPTSKLRLVANTTNSIASGTNDRWLTEQKSGSDAERPRRSD